MTDAEKLKSMKREEVQALAKELGVNAGGKTEEIIARIQAAEAAQEGQNAAAGQGTAAEAAQAAQEGQETAAGQEGTAEAAQAAQDAQNAAAAQDAAEELVTVKTIEKFFDLQLSQIKEKGEAYQVKKERAAELVAAGVAKIEK